MNNPNPKACCTGTVSDAKRPDVEALIRECGFTPVKSVSGRLSCLLVAAKTDSKSKQAKAADLGIPIVHVDTLADIEDALSDQMAQAA